MIKKGDEILVKVIELSSEGKGVSKLEDGFVIFSSSTLPGDEALVRISKKKSNYAEANLIELINKSPSRIDPPCKYFGICGGCKIQNYEYDSQIKFKTNVVKNAFERIGGFKNLFIPEAIKSDEVFFYRNKMEFSFSDDEWMFNPPLIESYSPEQQELHKEHFALGLHVPGFHSKIINIQKCFLQSEASNGILNFTREFFKSRNISVYSTKTQTGFLRFLIIRQSKNTNDMMINIITFDYNKELIEEYSRLLRNKFSRITTIINSLSQKKAQIAVGESEYILFGKGAIAEKLKTNYGSTFEFNISPQSFFQTNTLQAEKIFNILINFGNFNKSDNVLDLYCGTGSISIFISGLIKKVTGVELSADSVADASSNASLNKIENANFVCSDIKDFLEGFNKLKDFNKLILDPPRAGLHPKICDILSTATFEKIIYISCNPHSQARDLQIICSKGEYIIENIQPVDMFPHTYHVENIVSLLKWRK